eukprot:12095721-Ditylum_brightwellii.AAC.1
MKENNRLQLYFQNINEISTEEDLKTYMEDMEEKEVNIWGWAETNEAPEMTQQCSINKAEPVQQSQGKW